MLKSLTFNDIISESDINLEEFEKFLSNFFSSNVCLIPNAAFGLDIILKHHNISPGEKILIPAFMCENTVSFLIDKGYKINFVDHKPSSFDISIESLREVSDDKTKAIIIPHFFGISSNTQEVQNFVDGRFLVIDDAAQSFTARSDGKLLGRLGNAGVVSFGFGKAFSSGSGGLVISDNKDLIDNIRDVIQTETFSINWAIIPKIFFSEIVKSNFFKLFFYPLILMRRKRSRVFLNSKINFAYTKYQANLICKQLKRVDEINSFRVENYKNIKKAFNRLSSVDVVDTTRGPGSIYTKIPLLILNGSLSRSELIIKLGTAGIQASIPYPFLLNKKYSFSDVSCLCSNFLSKRLITIPNERLSQSQIYKINKILCK